MFLTLAQDCPSSAAFTAFLVRVLGVLPKTNERNSSTAPLDKSRLPHPWVTYGGVILASRTRGMHFSAGHVL